MEILRLKYLKPEGAKQKNEITARGELFASSFRKFDSRETHADLTNQLLANRLRMHDRKLNSCRQRLLFALQLIPRKCCLYSQGSFQRNRLKKCPKSPKRPAGYDLWSVLMNINSDNCEKIC